MGLKDRLVTWSRVNSPWILHFNSGACNSCDIELLAALIPTFDVERFGILLKATPRHADILVVTGGVTRQQWKRLKRIYEQMAEPKFVIAMGACGASGGVFRGCYSMRGGVDTVIPVTAFVPGCPPRPQAIIDAVVVVLGLLQGGAPAPEEPIIIGENGGVVTNGEKPGPADKEADDEEETETEADDDDDDWLDEDEEEEEEKGVTT